MTMRAARVVRDRGPAGLGQGGGAGARRVASRRSPAAVAALRRDLGDELFVRGGGASQLTAGGRRLAAAAAEMLGLMDQARREIARDAAASAALLRVAATRRRRRVGGGAAAGGVHAPRSRTSRWRCERRAGGRAFARSCSTAAPTSTLGPRPGREGAPASTRCRSCATGSSSSRRRATSLAGRRALPASALAGERWLVGPDGAEPATATGRFLARARIGTARRAGVRPSAAAPDAAVAAARASCSPSPTRCATQLRRGGARPARRDAARRSTGSGTRARWRPTGARRGRGRCGGSSRRRRPPRRCWRGDAGMPADRVRPSVYVTLWS